MKYLNILYKSNSTSISIGLKDESDADNVFTKIIDCRNGKKQDTFLITSNNAKVFINPLEIVHCELSDISI
jgi:hypothetical protein